MIDEKTSKLKILSFWDFLISSRQRDRPSGALQENLFPVFKLFPFPIEIQIEIEKILLVKSCSSGQQILRLKPKCDDDTDLIKFVHNDLIKRVVCVKDTTKNEFYFGKKKMISVESCFCLFFEKAANPSFENFDKFEELKK